MKHIGLFEGIGGFSLAGRWMGWETVAWVEIDPACQKVLSKNFPYAIGHQDIKTTDFLQYANKIDILTGGLPCQPFSAAGKRLGDNDHRSLWCEMLRAIKEVRPRWIVGENVVGITTMERGQTLRRIVSDLENIGYKVECFDIPAYCVGLQTVERHIWIIAKADGVGCEGRKTHQDTNNGFKGEFSGTNPGGNNRWNLSDTRFCGVAERVSTRVDRRGRERLKQLGNAIPPQIAFEIFKAIQKYENL